jgi:hypothetical protein
MAKVTEAECDAWLRGIIPNQKAQVRTQKQLNRKLRDVSHNFRAQVFNDYLETKRRELQAKEAVWTTCDSVIDCFETTD